MKVGSTCLLVLAFLGLLCVARIITTIDEADVYKMFL